MEILVDAKRPFSVGAKSVAKLNVSAINFATYAECWRERDVEQRRSGGDEMLATKAFYRARRLKQTKAYDRSNNVVDLDHMSFANMPRELFVKINGALDDDSDPRGAVISKDGDGLYTPVLYKLGTPFDFVDTNASSKPIGTEPKIIELEFIAKTGGDIEEVLCHQNSLDQTLALIKTCATPLGGGTSLQRLPSWMVNALTLADGFEIMAKILPIFLA